MSRTFGKRGGTSNFGPRRRRRHLALWGAKFPSSGLAVMKRVRRKKRRAHDRRLEREDA